MKGLPWLLEGVGNNSWPYSPGVLGDNMGIEYFPNDNFTMNVDGNTVSFRYKFRDFRGENREFAPWEALLKTSCQTWKGTWNASLLPFTSDTSVKDFELKQGNLRWISRLDDKPREEPFMLCKSSTGSCPRCNKIISRLEGCAD